MPIRLAVFDMAGTTVKDEEVVARAFRSAFVKNGYFITLGDAHPYMGVKKIVAVRMMLERLEIEFTPEQVNEIHDDFVKEMTAYYQHDPFVAPFGDTESVFALLKENGVRIALNTGFPRVIAEAIVTRFQWVEKGLVDDYIASDEVEEGRPSVQMIRQLMERAGVSDPGEVLKAGDTTVDIEEGKNVGCKYIIAVTTGSGTADELLTASPTHIVQKLSDIPALLYS